MSVASKIIELAQPIISVIKSFPQKARQKVNGKSEILLSTFYFCRLPFALNRLVNFPFIIV